MSRSRYNSCSCSFIRVARNLWCTVCGKRAFYVVGEQIVADFIPTAVHVTLGKKSQNGIHGTIVVVDLCIFRFYGLGNKLSKSNLRSIGVVSEYLLYFRHIASATRNDNTSQKFVCKFYRDLIPGIFNDFLYSGFNNFYKLFALYYSVLVNRIVESWVDILDVCICLSIFQFHFLSLLLFYLKTGQILGDIITAKWND